MLEAKKKAGYEFQKHDRSKKAQEKGERIYRWT